MNCRICGRETVSLLDLGQQPLANRLLKFPSEPYGLYPLELHCCTSCYTGQLGYFVDDAILYEHYLYITPTTAALTAHYRNLEQLLTSHGAITAATQVLEIGSNIGDFLRFLCPKVNSVLGVDPANEIAAIANSRGIPTVADFFRPGMAWQGRHQLVIMRHCLAHNSDPREMLEGAADILAEDGYLLVECGYLLPLFQARAYDQIYHEHKYIFSLTGLRHLLLENGFTIVAVQDSPVQGGSLVVLATRRPAAKQCPAVDLYLQQEAVELTPAKMRMFRIDVARRRTELLKTLGEFAQRGKTVYAFGASAKATVLLNYLGLDASRIPFVVDSTPCKWDHYLPGVQIPIISEEKAREHPPDCYLLTIWNFKQDIIEKVLRQWHQRIDFIVPQPVLEVVRTGQIEQA